MFQALFSMLMKHHQRERERLRAHAVLPMNAQMKTFISLNTTQDMPQKIFTHTISTVKQDYM